MWFEVYLLKGMELNYFERIQPRDISLVKLHKLAMIQNALEDGWRVEKRGTSYIFTKSHENQREIFEEDYLQVFLTEKLQIDGLRK